MTASNHVLTGVLVATALKEPILALPAALASHFVIDSLPHWNYWLPNQRQFKRWAIYADMILSLALLLTLSVVVVEISTGLIFSAGLLAILPDMMWFPYLVLGKNTPADKDNLLHKLRRFHLKIQWSESVKGLLFEIVWFVLMLGLIVKTAL